MQIKRKHLLGENALRKQTFALGINGYDDKASFTPFYAKVMYLNLLKQTTNQLSLIIKQICSTV